MRWLFVILLCLAGCGTSPPPQSSHPEPPPPLSTPAAAPPAPRLPVPAALGLGKTATPQEMADLEKWAATTARYRGQGCGHINRDGKSDGVIVSIYEVQPPGHDKPVWISFSRLQRARTIEGMSGPGFWYRLNGGRFMLQPVE